MARTLARATGMKGRIQPRIAPITAPDPWQGPVDLEFATLHEVEPTPSPDPVQRSVPSRPQPPRPAATREAPPPSPSSESLTPASPKPAPPKSSLPQSRESIANETPASVPEPRGTPRPIESHAVLEVPALRNPIERRSPSEPSVREAPDDRPVEVGLPARPRAADAIEQVVEIESPRESNSSARRVPSFRAPSIQAEARAPARTRDVDLPLEIHTETTAPADDTGSAPLRSGLPSRSDAAGPNKPSRPPAAENARVPTRGAPIDPTARLPVPRRREATGEPVVRVEIGRIELRAPPREPERVERGIPKPEAFVSLKQYLRERGGS